MAYQYQRELTQHEATTLANACATAAERLVIWTMLDTGLRVSELTGLTRQNIDWQQHRLMIHGKGGPWIAEFRRKW
jgi:integrase/recombinase XerD